MALFFTLEFGRRDLSHDFCVFSTNCRRSNVAWPLAFRLLYMESRAIDLRSCRTYRLDQIAGVLPIRWTKCEHDLQTVIWTVHYLQIKKEKYSNEIGRHPATNSITNLFFRWRRLRWLLL